MILGLGLALGCLLGCSEYPDPFTGNCPEISDFEVVDLGARTATLVWETDQLSLDRVELRPDGGLAVLFHESERKNKHRLVVEGLLPKTRYKGEILRDRGDGIGEVCAPAFLFEFTTFAATPDPITTGTPVGDSETPVFGSGFP